MKKSAVMNLRIARTSNGVVDRKMRDARETFACAPTSDLDARSRVGSTSASLLEELSSSQRSREVNISSPHEVDLTCLDGVRTMVHSKAYFKALNRQSRTHSWSHYPDQVAELQD